MGEIKQSKPSPKKSVLVGCIKRGEREMQARRNRVGALCHLSSRPLRVVGLSMHRLKAPMKRIPLHRSVPRIAAGLTAMPLYRFFYFYIFSSSIYLHDWPLWFLFGAGRLTSFLILRLSLLLRDRTEEFDLPTPSPVTG